MIDLDHSRNLAMRRRAGCFRGLFLLPAVITGFSFLLAGQVTAQTFTTLHSFNGSSDGAGPQGGLILSGNTLYGTAEGGGKSGRGTVFALKTDGTGFTNLYSLYAYPLAGLVLSGNSLYGTESGGGYSGYGTVFAVSTDGTGFNYLHVFTAVSGGSLTNSDGASPYAGLILSGNTLYGTASTGGSWGLGTLFKVNTNGTGFTTVHSFNGCTDGAVNPEAGLVLSGNTLYGTTSGGGPCGADTIVFAVRTDGTGFTTLHHISSSFAGLILSGDTLYGTDLYTVFALKTDGTGFTNLHAFTALPGSYPYTNSDGAYPYAGLITNSSGNTLYGTTSYGGSSGAGTVFAVNTDGSGFTNLHNFAATATNSSGVNTNSDGAVSVAGLLLSGNTLYGTAQSGGSSGNGTVFSLSFRPQLTITPSGANVILSWPTNVAGFDYTGYTLQSTTNLVSPAAWVTNSPSPVVIGGQNTVTNPISGAQQFYRLSH